VRVRLTVLLAASAALLVGAAALHAQFRSRVAAVRVDVLATERGAPIPNLAAADFEVLDNGVPQQIDAVYAEHEPLDVLFAFDRSLSVRGETLRGLLEAAHAAIDQLTSDDRAAVLAFDHSFHLEQPMTEELTAVHRAIDGIDAGGSTSLFDALYAALTVAETGGRRTLILLFTDGIDNLSWLHEDAALRVARQSEAVVYTVAYEAPHPPTIVPYDKRVLQEIAETTGGRVLAASETGRLKASFVDVMREMRTRYLLTYTPTNADTPGFHTLSVKLKRRSGRIVARRGYEVARRQ
jgi:Ca-activated chloride channel family protein